MKQPKRVKRQRPPPRKHAPRPRKRVLVYCRADGKNKEPCQRCLDYGTPAERREWVRARLRTDCGKDAQRRHWSRVRGACQCGTHIYRCALALAKEARHTVDAHLLPTPGVTRFVGVNDVEMRVVRIDALLNRSLCGGS